jgi:hypothetical protein
MGFKLPDHKDRAAVAAKARAAALEKFKTAPEPTPEELAARAERAAAAEEKRLAAIAASAAKREAQRQAALDARAAKEAAKLEALNRIILSEEEELAAKKAERDARYAARKAAKSTAKAVKKAKRT